MIHQFSAFDKSAMRNDTRSGSGPWTKCKAGWARPVPSGNPGGTGLSPEEYPLATWRLLNTGPADGAANMAIDEAILTAVAEGKSPPTLRFFAWEPPCLSIGYSQAADDVDITKCQQAGVNVVRRPTGGRAILHTDELTCSIVASQGEPRVAGGVVESYRRLSAGLVRGLRFLGVDVAQAEAGHGTVAPIGQDADVSAACFDAPSAYEVTAGGKKLVGSAQVRRRGAVLQHGSLLLQGDITRICRYLVVPSEEQRQELCWDLRARAEVGSAYRLQQRVRHMRE